MYLYELHHIIIPCLCYSKQKSTAVSIIDLFITEKKKDVHSLTIMLGGYNKYIFFKIY